VRIRPAAAFGLLYLGLILCGAALLLLPRATPPGAPLAPLDALFTSTSAVCVTGLIVRDTATEFTLVGQVIILILIQLGGLGIMSLTAFLSLLLGRGIGIRESSLLREVFQVPLWSEVGHLLRFIFAMTLVVEGIGAALLYIGLGEVVPVPETRLFTAVFHAVSAFCNAGFSTFSDSLMGVAGDGLIVGTIMGLLVAGGLGFTVAAQLAAFGVGRLRTGRGGRLALQTRLVLLLSAALMVAGAVLLLLLERGAGLGEGGLGARLSHALFQSATCRTAGFNTVDLARWGAPALLVMMILMFIGGAPGSTAGGVKVTTLVVMWANVRALRQGFGRVRVGDREIEPTAVNRALIVVTGAAMILAVGIFTLLLTEGSDLLTTAFEATSALGTVGLTLGLTPDLSAAGRWVVILLMFVGRLGPLTLAYGLSPARRDPQVRLPRADIMIG
jgi:trk system potassium uptake protein TrkH